MKSVFDYVFYRVYQFYAKKDGAPAIYASGVLTVMQWFFLLSVLAVIRLLIDFPIPPKHYVVPLLILLIAINWYSYERDFDINTLKYKWESEDELKRRLRGYLLVFFLVFFILFPIMIVVFKHNLGWID